MLVKTYAKKLKGGNGYRRFMLLFHFLLWLVATAALLLCSLELLGTLGIEAVDGAVAKAKDLAAPVSAPAFEFIQGVIPFSGAIQIVEIAALVLWVLLLWAWTRLCRRRYIYCQTNAGTAVYSCKVFQKFSVLTLSVDNGTEDVTPEVWFTDEDMMQVSKPRRRMKAKSLVLFGFVEVPEVVEETPVVEESVEEVRVELPTPVVEEPREPEIQAIIREALEREGARAVPPTPVMAPVAEPAPMAAPVADPTPAPTPVEPAPVVAPVAESAAEDDDDDEEEESEIREVTVNGRTFHMVIRYSRSFTARVIQAPEALKNYYAEIKNEILSYDLVKSRISWKHDAFNRGRLQLAKIVVRGKSLCVYLALDPNAYEYEKYHQADKSGTNAYAKVPMLIRIKSDLGLRKAKFLVSEMMANYDIERGETQDLDFLSSYSYRDTKTLIGEGLIKELETPEETE